jgi:hypothetical protein
MPVYSVLYDCKQGAARVGAHDVQGLALEALGDLAFCAPNRQAFAHPSLVSQLLLHMCSSSPSLCFDGRCTPPSCTPRLTEDVGRRNCCLCALQGGAAGGGAGAATAGAAGGAGRGGAPARPPRRHTSARHTGCAPCSSSPAAGPVLMGLYDDCCRHYGTTAARGSAPYGIGHVQMGLAGENEAVRRAVGRAPLAGRGVRILAMDGGGMKASRDMMLDARPFRQCWMMQIRTKCASLILLQCMPRVSFTSPQGLATLRMLWQLQERTGCRMHELFDLVCGTSTGGILAAALAVRCVSLEECEEIYRWGGFAVLLPGQPGLNLVPLQCHCHLGPTCLRTTMRCIYISTSPGWLRVLGAKVFSRPLVTKGDVETWKDSFYRVYKSGQQSVRVAV